MKAKRTPSKHILLFFPFLMVGLFIGTLWSELQASPTKPVKLTVLFSTDLYGNLREFRCKRPGVKDFQAEEAKIDISNLLYQVKQIRQKLVQLDQLPPPLIFNTGDNLGTALTARFLLEYEGLAGVDFIAKVFHRFSFDLIGLGNHASIKNRHWLYPARYLVGVGESTCAPRC